MEELPPPEAAHPAGSTADRQDLDKVNFLNLYPLSFSEFLLAVGKEQHASLIQAEKPDAALLKAFSLDFKELLRQYFFIGGMPEAVAAWVETNDFNEVRRVQTELLRTYENDVSNWTRDFCAA